MANRPYYEAYDDRYRQVHRENLEWFSRTPSPIVGQVMEKYRLGPDARILELGCGEGRDAIHLLRQGFRVLATDISPEAISHCRRLAPVHRDAFQVLDCVSGQLEERFDFLYAVAVVHMLVEDDHRKGFYQFIRHHLKEHGIALICTMGDGKTERKSDISSAFSLQERAHPQSGKKLQIANTSCRMVDFSAFQRELEENSLHILEEGITAMEPEFNQIMYAVVT